MGFEPHLNLSHSLVNLSGIAAVDFVPDFGNRSFGIRLRRSGLCSVNKAVENRKITEIMPME